MTNDNTTNISFLENLSIEDLLIVPISEDESVYDLDAIIADENAIVTPPKPNDDSPNNDDHIQLLMKPISDVHNAISDSHSLNEDSTFISTSLIHGNEYIQSSTTNNQSTNEECAPIGNAHSNIHIHQTTIETGHDSLEGRNGFTDMMTIQDEDHHEPCEQTFNSPEEYQNDEYNYIYDALNESDEYLIYESLI